MKFSNDSKFVTDSKDGTVSLWTDKQVEKSERIFAEWTLVFSKDGYIFAASKNKDVVELNLKLAVVKKFKGWDYQPYSIDANENNLVVGYGSGFVGVHSRNEFDQNGMYPEVMVSLLYR